MSHTIFRWFLILILMLGYARPAQALAPDNDHLANAATIPALPFSRSVDLSEATLEPGEEYVAEPHLQGVVESVYVTHGRMRVGPRDATVDLGPGDRATFPADQPHVYEALEPSTRAVLVLAYR